MAFDTRKQTYRRVYTGYLNGRRINSVSMEAEATFWRLHMLADDFGNLIASPRLLCAAAFPRRESVTEADVIRWSDELLSAGLIDRYSDPDDDALRYFHIVGFSKIQPAQSRNGTPVRRVAAYPGEPESSREFPGDAESFREKPGTSESDQNQNQNQNQSRVHPGESEGGSFFESAELTELTENDTHDREHQARPKAENRTARSSTSTLTRPARTASRLGPKLKTEPVPGPNATGAAYRLRVHEMLERVGGTADFAKRIIRESVTLAHLEAAVDAAKNPRVKNPPGMVTTHLVRLGYVGLRGEA